MDEQYTDAGGGREPPMATYKLHGDSINVGRRTLAVLGQGFLVV